MLVRILGQISIGAIAAIVACGVFGPDDRSFRIELPFCGQTATPLSWAAVKRGSGDWTYLTPTGGIASFEARGAVGVAYGNPLETRVYLATADEFSQVSCFRDRPATSVLEGDVRDVPASDRFYVTVGPVTATSTPFAAFVPDGPMDIVARTEKISTLIPQRVIVRHNVNLVTGSEIPNLDFSSTESRAFESATATTESSGAGAFTNTFWPWGNRHVLASGGLDRTPLPLQYFAVPEALLGPNDYHTLNIRDFSVNAPRELNFYYRRARPITLAMGPPAMMPVGFLRSASPCAQLEARVASQPEYSSFIVVSFWVNPGQNDQTMVEVGVSKAFLGGTPSTWIVETPNITSAGGECIVRPFPNSWFIAAMPQEGRIALHLGARGRDGEIQRFSIGTWSPP